MNPLNPLMNNFFGRKIDSNILGLSGKPKAGYGKHKDIMIAKRRAKNKVGYKSRRKNVILAGTKRCKIKA